MESYQPIMTLTLTYKIKGSYKCMVEVSHHSTIQTVGQRLEEAGQENVEKYELTKGGKLVRKYSKPKPEKPKEAKQPTWVNKSCKTSCNAKVSLYGFLSKEGLYNASGYIFNTRPHAKKVAGKKERFITLEYSEATESTVIRSQGFTVEELVQIIEQYKL